ncbi:hypothetical protein PACILC2_12880 [Paenibacillus cisolokensis]|uniref:Na+/H+ antiporter subunit G n=1 Tax=Paenibacillus cisolokensis TaxID=1658519 RepID=A0ABQ4N3G9_9BACL|nr:hypothetical protein PACILC2_12880 [Paenibacillus cisolokensis]
MSTETMSAIGELLLGMLVLAGAALSALSAFGMIRLPDVYLRSHAATKSATLGVLFILLGAFLYLRSTWIISAPSCCSASRSYSRRRRWQAI